MALRTQTFKSKYQEQARKDFHVIQAGYKPDLHLILIGIDNYKSPTPPLNGCVNDAKAIGKAFQSQEGKLYEKVHTHMLIDAEATKDNIMRVVRDVHDKVSLFDFVIVYFSGHGTGVEESNDGFFLTYDEDEGLGISGEEFCNQLMLLPSKVILILDIVAGGNFLTTLMEANQSDDLYRLTHNVFGISGTSIDELAKELIIDGENRGAFSYALTNSFSSTDADLDGNGIVYLDELLRYTSKVVCEKVNDQNVMAVIPSTMTNIPLFQIGDTFALPKEEIALSGHIEDHEVVEGIMTFLYDAPDPQKASSLEMEVHQLFQEGYYDEVIELLSSKDPAKNIQEWD